MEQGKSIFDVKNKVIVITGACGLLGKTISKGLHEVGAKIVTCDRKVANPKLFSKNFDERALGIELDVTNAVSVKNAVAKILNKFGSIDVLINNHQKKPEGFLEAQADNFPEHLWDEILEVNLKGTFLTCREIGRQMISQGNGSIINMASTYGIVSSTPQLYPKNSMGNPVAYTASKGGVIALTKYLAVYWAEKGVRVNCVSPHGVSNDHEEEFKKKFSEFSPMKRLMEPEEILGAILFLASNASSYTTGANILAEGGWTAY